MISTDVAIYATGKSPIKHRGSYNARDDGDRVMAPIWKNYEFRHQFSPQEEKNLPSVQDALQN